MYRKSGPKSGSIKSVAKCSKKVSPCLQGHWGAMIVVVHTQSMLTWEINTLTRSFLSCTIDWLVVGGIMAIRKILKCRYTQIYVIKYLSV